MTTFCSTQAQADAEIAEWLSQAPGIAFDPDGQYGLQCVDLADGFSDDIFDAGWRVTLGGVGGARELMDTANRDFWTVTFNNPSDPNQLPPSGVLLVWDGAPGVNPYGHVAAGVAADRSGVNVVQQDGFAPPLRYVSGGWYSNKPAHAARLGYDNPGTGPLRGWLRPRYSKVVYTGADKRRHSTGAKPPRVTKPTTPTTGASMSKTYRLETKWTTGFQCSRSYFGYPDKPTGITLHHWGSYGQTFDSVANFLCNTTDPERVANPTSAHYVVEDGRIACLAVPERATYHSGSTQGNGATIGIECRPEKSAGDLDTVVQLVYELETTYGSLNIYLHREWFATSCPGKYADVRDEIVSRVNAMHQNKGRDPKLSTAAPAKKPAAAPPKKPAAAPPKKPAAAPPKKTVTNTDNALVTDINGNVRPLKMVLDFRFGKYEKNINETAALAKRVAELSKKIGA